MGILLGILCFSETVRANDLLQKEWKKGQVTLINGQHIKGKLLYDLENNVVVLRSGKKMRAFGAHSVQSFSVADDRAGIREFVVLPYSSVTETKKLMFFQMMFDDSFVLLAREKEISKKDIRTSKTPMRLHPNKEHKAFLQEYYVILPDGSFQRFKSGYKRIAEILSLSKNEVPKIGQYIHENNIDLRQQTGIIQLIHHFVNRENIASR